MRTLFSIWLICILANISSGQYRFRTLSIEDGLTENSITDIFQDSDGYLWFGTQDGISRYDGYAMKNFNITGNDSTSLSDNFLWGIDEDSLGYIWCCSRYGVNRIDKVTGACKSFFTTPHENVNASQQANSLTVSSGNIYAVFAGKIYWIPVQERYQNGVVFEQFRSRELTENNVFKLFTSKDEKKLFALTNRGVYRFEENVVTEIPNFSAGAFTSFLPTSYGHGDTIWFSNGSSLYHLTTNSFGITQVPLELDDAVIWDIGLVDGGIWLATDEGVWIVKEGEIKRRILKDDSYKYGLTSNYISAILVDHFQNVWLGTSGNGICLYESSIDQFKYIGQELLRRSQLVRSTVQRGNSLFICTEDKLNVLRLSSNRLTDSKFLQDKIVNQQEVLLPKGFEVKPTCLGLGKDSSLLVGTQEGKVLVFSSTSDQIKVIESPFIVSSTTQVSAFYTRRNGEVWIATYGGIMVLDEAYNLIKKFESDTYNLQSNYFLSVYEDLQRNVWLGSNVGILKYLEAQDSFEQIAYNRLDLSNSPGFNFVSGFVDVGDDNLWMATYGGGLSKMDKATKSFTHYTTEHGLANNVLNGLVYDGDHELWTSTNKGISCFNLRSEKFSNFDKSDGIYFSEFMLNAYHQNEFGELLFGSPGGLVVFNPNDVRKTSSTTPMVFTDLEVNYKRMGHRLKNETLHIFPSDKAITIHFAALHFSTSNQVKYQYKLEGYDGDWVETNEVKAVYTSLPEGEYTFLLNASIGGEPLSANVLKYNWVVHPPYYKSWWFLTCSTLVILSILILIIRHFAQLKIKKRLRALRIKEEVHKEKQRISRDLHDTVGAQITYLISSIDHESNIGRDSQKTYDVLGDTARNIMTQLRNVLWVLDREEVSYLDFTRKVSDYANKVLEPTSIRCSMQIKDEENTTLTPAVVSNLFRVIQEALNNIIKHSKATKVKINFGIEAEMLEISIADNGIGITEESKKNGHYGIKNIMDRVSHINGTTQFMTTNHGLTIMIKVPLK